MRRQHAAAPAAIASVLAQIAADVAGDSDVMRQLEELRLVRVQRLLTTEPTEVNKLDQQTSHILARLAQRLVQPIAPYTDHSNNSRVSQDV